MPTNGYVTPALVVPGSIYEGFSPRGQRALAELRAAFEAAGFYAEKERRTERTLRVYPERRWKYPLLNPGLVGAKRAAPVGISRPSVICPVFSDGDKAITRLLANLPRIDNCSFIDRVGQSGQFYRHGYFIFPIFFAGPSRSQRIDFSPLHPSLSQLQLHLSSIGFAEADKPRSGVGQTVPTRTSE